MSTTKPHIQRHLEASLEEKVEILAHNPFRFYIEENVWIPQGAERIKYLEELLEEAVKEEKYELCQRIVALKEQLQLDPTAFIP